MINMEYESLQMIFNVLLSWALFGLIWTIQLTHYPSFRFIDTEQFLAFHEHHTQSITIVVLPLMVAELGLAIWLIFYQSQMRWLFGICLLIVIAIWMSTFLIQVPLHNALVNGKDPFINSAIGSNQLGSDGIMDCESSYCYIYLNKIIEMKKKIAVLTGAGISAESGIKTFRDADGLWENHDIMEVASPQGWQKDAALVLNFYNQRRRQLHEVQPNAAHISIANLEDRFDVIVITQNIDDLHERAGSTNIIHLHGELFKARSTKNPNLIYEWKKDIVLGDHCEQGNQLRPHIVWFGEEVPMLERAAKEISDANIVMVIGSSMQVYPAAGLVGIAPIDAEIYYVDPFPSLNYELEMRKNLNVIEEKATTGVPKVIEMITA